MKRGYTMIFSIIFTGWIFPSLIYFLGANCDSSSNTILLVHNGIVYAGEKVGSNITQAKCLLKVWTGQLCPNRVELVLPETMNEQD